MSKKKNVSMTCPSCGNINESGDSVCLKCGRIISVSDKTPVDYKPFVALITVIACIAVVVAIILGIKGKWGDFIYWIETNKDSFYTLIEVLWIVLTSAITLKVTKDTHFTTLYGSSVIVSFLIVLVTVIIEACVTGETAYGTNGFRMIVDILGIALDSTIMVWIIRRISQ